MVYLKNISLRQKETFSVKKQPIKVKKVDNILLIYYVCLCTIFTYSSTLNI